MIMNGVQLLIAIKDIDVGTQERRKREVEQRRAAILDAARTLFWQKGYEKTTIPEIAQSAELAPGTIYLYFPGKSALYTALLAEGYGMLAQNLRDCMKADLPPRERVRAMMDTFLDFASESPEYFGIIFFVLQREGTEWEEVTQEQLVNLKALETECKDMVASVIRKTSFQAVSSELAAVDAFWSMLVGVVFFFGKSPDFPAIAAEARRILLQAVLGDE